MNTIKRMPIIVLSLVVFAIFLSASNVLASEKIVMNMAHVLPPGSVWDVGMDYMQKRIQQLSNNRIEVKTFKATFGGERQMYEALQLGTLQSAIITCGPLVGFLPEAAIFNLPMLFKDWDHAFKCVDGPFGEWFGNKAVEKGFRILGWWSLGARNISHGVRPIEKFEDMKGLKIRTMESPPIIEMIKAWGAIPVPMSIKEVYSALQRGAIDGIEGGVSSQYKMKHYEVLKYAVILNEINILSPFYVSEKWWKTMPKDVKWIVKQAELEARPIQRAADVERQKSIMDIVRKEYNVTFTFPDPEPFRKAAMGIYPKFEEQIGKENLEWVKRIGEPVVVE